METLDTNFSNSNLGISNQSKNYLLYAAKWASFLAIVGFVTLGLLILAGLIMLLIGSQFSRITGGVPVAMFALIYVGMAAIYFFQFIIYFFLDKK